MTTFNRIEFQGKTIIAVCVFIKVVEGNHIKSSRDYRATLFTDKAEEINISESLYESHIKGSGIRKFGGCLETGGGRHTYYGQSISDAREWVNNNLT